jgi:hypothetical protein
MARLILLWEESAMDLRVYYQKLRKTESEIQDEYPVVVSRETSDGGKQGLKTQVPRSLAARLITDGKAELATAEEAAQFHARVAEEWQAAREHAKAEVPVKPARSGARATKKS